SSPLTVEILSKIFSMLVDASSWEATIALSALIAAAPLLVGGLGVATPKASLLRWWTYQLFRYRVDFVGAWPATPMGPMRVGVLTHSTSPGARGWGHRVLRRR